MAVPKADEYHNSPVDQASFQHLTDNYRYELLIHCYRILGSLEDAEDALQETLLRAWRRLDTLKLPSALRAWMYRIATNVCLDMLDSRKARLMPTFTHTAADPHEAFPPPVSDPVWLDPLPESYLEAFIPNPEQQVEALENVSLAFLVALQKLPGRQRAILILCDVLDWKAREAADALNLTVTAVNSALQRARATLKKHQQENIIYTIPSANSPETSDLLSRYVQAWETADSTRLVALLREDAALTMPPFSVWYRGRSVIQTFLESFVFAAKTPGEFRLVAVRANGSPAFAVYQRDEGGSYQISALHVLTIHANQIVQIDDFLAVDQNLFSRFNLPQPGS
jgi:RNA polymerase sigma-70 factor, ECF subfamily